MKVGTISRNTTAALAQAVFASVCLFLVYRIIVREAGLEQLGIWSLLMVGSSIARVGDVSGAGSLGRFIAKMKGAGEVTELGETVHTVLLTSLAINTVMCLVLLAPLPFLLSTMLPQRHIQEAWTMVPFVVVSIIFGGLSAGVSAGIDGVQRVDQRAFVSCCGSLALLIVAAVLVPIYGIIGFGYAQTVSFAVLIALGWFVLRRHIPQIGWMPIYWRQHIFRSTTGFGLKLSLISILTLLFEPLVKLAFNNVGGPQQVALYELASRVTTQVRGLIIASVIPLVPALAALRTDERVRLQELMRRAMRGTAFAAVAAAITSLMLSPLVSYVVLGEISREMLWLSIPLTFAWSANILGISLYMAAQADGRMRWNTLSHVVLAVAVIVGLMTTGTTYGFGGLMISIVVGIMLSLGCQMFGNAALLQLNNVVYRSMPVLLASLGLIFLACLLAWMAARIVLG
jgi:O-antigen/teichoic acid export membrane protein